MRLEATLTKSQILESYLSRTYFGEGCFGLRAPAQYTGFQGGTTERQQQTPDGSSSVGTGNAWSALCLAVRSRGLFWKCDAVWTGTIKQKSG